MSYKIYSNYSVYDQLVTTTIPSSQHLDYYRSKYHAGNITYEGDPLATRLWLGAEVKPEETAVEACVVFDDVAREIYEDLVRNVLLPGLDRQFPRRQCVDWQNGEVVKRCRRVIWILAEKLCQVDEVLYGPFANTLFVVAMLPLAKSDNPVDSLQDRFFYPELPLPSLAFIRWNMERTRWMQGFASFIVSVFIRCYSHSKSPYSLAHL